MIGPPHTYLSHNRPIDGKDIHSQLQVSNFNKNLLLLDTSNWIHVPLPFAFQFMHNLMAFFVIFPAVIEGASHFFDQKKFSKDFHFNILFCL